jgi:hypothetical protein
MVTKKKPDSAETAVYSHSVLLAGEPMGPGFVVRVVVEPAAERAFTVEELEHVQRVLPDAGIEPGALLDGSLKPSPLKRSKKRAA